MSESIWQQVECGGYRADLETWRRLASEAAVDGDSAAVLDVGAGNGRVSLDLAEHGHRVTALDSDAELLAELQRRERKLDLSVRCVRGDGREFHFRKPFDLVIAPMQLLQLLGGADRRAGFYRSAYAALKPGALLAIALMDMSGEPTGDAYDPPLPDVREIDGWVYSSQPLTIRMLDRGRELSLERLRTTVSPSGEMSEEHNTVKLRLVGPDRCETEARALGLVAAGRIDISPTADHVGSVVVLLQRG